MRTLAPSHVALCRCSRGALRSCSLGRVPRPESPRPWTGRRLPLTSDGAFTTFQGGTQRAHWTNIWRLPYESTRFSSRQAMRPLRFCAE